MKVTILVEFYCELVPAMDGSKSAGSLVDQLRDDWIGGRVGALHIEDVTAAPGVRIKQPAPGDNTR